MDKKLLELKTELTEEEKVKILFDGIEAVESLRRIADKAYNRKQNEINRNNTTNRK